MGREQLVEPSGEGVVPPQAEQPLGGGAPVGHPALGPHGEDGVVGCLHHRSQDLLGSDSGARLRTVVSYCGHDPPAW